MDASTIREMHRIQRRLDAWELEHLRAHAAALHEQVEQLKGQVEQLKRDLAWSDDCAEMWQQTAELLQEAPAAHIAINRDGQVVGVLQ